MIITINYYTKQIYGETRMYLAKSQDAILWRNMSGRKTITEADMTNMSQLTGVEFNRVFEAEA